MKSGPVPASLVAHAQGWSTEQLIDGAEGRLRTRRTDWVPIAPSNVRVGDEIRATHPGGAVMVGKVSQIGNGRFCLGSDRAPSAVTVSFQGWVFERLAR